MKKFYKEPEVNVVNYKILEEISLTIKDSLSGWDQGDGEEFGF